MPSPRYQDIAKYTVYSSSYINTFSVRILKHHLNTYLKPNLQQPNNSDKVGSRL